MVIILLKIVVISFIETVDTVNVPFSVMSSCQLIVYINSVFQTSRQSDRPQRSLNIRPSRMVPTAAI